MHTPLTVYQSNDTLFKLTLVIAGTTTRLNLTGLSLEFYLKSSPSQSDASALAIYSTGTGEIVVTSAANGELTVKINSDHVGIPGKYWYHLDTVSGSDRTTRMTGPLTVLDT